MNNSRGILIRRTSARKSKWNKKNFNKRIFMEAQSENYVAGT
jgi:hypothetical protein